MQMSSFTTHTSNLPADVQQACAAARIVLVPCDPQPPEGVTLQRIELDDGTVAVAWLDWEGKPIESVCPYAIGDVVELRWECLACVETFTTYGRFESGRVVTSTAKLRITKISGPVEFGYERAVIAWCLRSSPTMEGTKRCHAAAMAYRAAKLPPWAWVGEGDPV